MSAQKCQTRPQLAVFWCALVFSLPAMNGFAATPPTLSNPAWSAGQFQFVLHTETNANYVVQSSADLRSWTAVLTNVDSRLVRTITVPATNPHAFWRVVRVPRFTYAIAARGNVLLAGSGRIDSFNSALPGIESDVNGQYTPAFATDRARVVTTSNSVGVISFGNMAIYGSIATGPGGTAIYGPNGNVGSTTWNDNPAYNGMIEPGHFTDDFHMSIPEGALPATFGSILQPPPGPGIIGGTSYNYVLGNGDYRLSSLTLASNERMIVTGDARIHITGATMVSEFASITIATNASLQWYGGNTVSIGGNGVVNVGGTATNFSLFGLRTCPTITYNGSARFIGTIYAPGSAVSISGTADAIGAVVAGSFTLSGTMGLHFDENLKSAGPFF
jgi:hypothetical protein